MGVSAIEVKIPRVSNAPAELSPTGFESKIVRRYVRTSRQTRDLFRKLYLEGLAAGDFEPVFQELVGETAALSPNAIARLRTDVTRWMKRRDSALYLVFKVALRLSERWRALRRQLQPDALDRLEGISQDLTQAPALCRRNIPKR